MTNFSPARATQKPSLTDRERREVVVQHKLLPPLSTVVFDLLIVGSSRTEGCGDERLRLTPSEQRRTMHAGSNTNFTADRTYLVKLPPIGPHPFVEDACPSVFLDQTVERLFVVISVFCLVFIKSIEHMPTQIIHSVALFDLVLNAEGILDLLSHTVFDLIDNRFVDLVNLKLALDWLELVVDPLLQVYERLNRRLGKLKSVEDVFLGNFVGSRLQHNDGFSSRGKDEIKVTFSDLATRRVNDKPSVDHADANRCNWNGERNWRAIQGCRRTGDA